MGSLVPSQFAYGRTDAKIAIIGEAPTKEEMAAQQPFVGSNGRFLNDCLRTVGLARPAMYIGNICRFPVMDRRQIIEGKKNRWTEQGQAEYDLFVERIAGIHPTVWVPLGEIALFALTGQTGITKWRGSILPCTVPGHEHEKVIPSLHPAHILRGNMLDRALLLADLERVKKDAAFPELRLHQATLHIEPTFDEVMEFLGDVKAQGISSHDIEVLRGVNSQVTCMSFGLNAHEAMSIPFYDGRQEDLCYWSIEQEYKIWMAIADVLEDPEHIQIGQNLHFDNTFLFLQNGILPCGPILDSMLIHRTMYPDLKAGLDLLCSLYTRIPYYKDDRKIWENPEKDQRTFWTYNARDAVAPIAALENILPDMDEADFKNYARRLQILPALTYMEVMGVLVDEDAVVAAKAEAQKRLDKAQEALNLICGFHLNVNSSKQMQEYFYGPKSQGGLGIQPYLNLKTKKPSLDDLALQRIIRKYDREEARLAQIIRAEGKMISTYFDITLDPDKRLRCAYNPRGTKTGRLSSAESVRGTGTNMQNQPEEFKNFIVVDPPREDGAVQVFAELDKKGAEWVVVAYISRNKNMLEIVENDLDAHVRTGHLITGVPEAMIVAEAAALKHTTSVRELAELRSKLFPTLASIARILPRNMTIRQMGKKANHGLNYDLGEEAFSIRNDLSRTESAKIIAGYYAAYGTDRYHKMIQDMLRKPKDPKVPGVPGKTLRDCFGNEYKFLGPLNDDTFRLAYSFLPQSTVVNMVNRGALEPLMFDPFYKLLRLRAQIHDSVLTAAWLHLDKRDDVIQWCAELSRLGLQDMMPVVEYHGHPFQIKTDCKIGTVWGKLEEIKLHPDPEVMYDNVMPILEKLYV